ncbi:phosphotransferase [Kribbella solani]|uniref:phosphotransferase enzyme family protein n=1 Tax=Kribbella solani TaxID=236067 RepID=UPI0029B3597E|nr:phosphotransferase [Kribbella solani]MDX2971407.1 phosphotransferase [Kribbella solani]MDX3004148.1 phosphotransferase [Kribbella solani]
MDVAGVLRERWDLKATRLEVLTGGMNSATWLASSEGDAWRVVVKSVDVDDASFGPGLELAVRLDDAGVVSGRPWSSKGGRLVERVDDRQVAVLEYVSGEELGKTAADRTSIGDLLGRVHTIAAVETGDLQDWLRVLMPFDDYLDLEPWIRPAVADAIARATALGEISWAWLHGDAAREAFRRQPDGSVALIDWGSALPGPILYDVASAVMYADGSPEHVVAAYVRRRPDLAGEIARGLDAFLHVRWAVQAGYFAWRIGNNVLTGISDEGENRKGLADARRAFGG